MVVTAVLLEPALLVGVLQKAPGAEPGWCGLGEAKKSGLLGDDGSSRVHVFLSPRPSPIWFILKVNEPLIGNNLLQATQLLQSQLS